MSTLDSVSDIEVIHDMDTSLVSLTNTGAVICHTMTLEQYRRKDAAGRIHHVRHQVKTSGGGRE